jgi:hypothetical protein
MCNCIIGYVICGVTNREEVRGIWRWLLKRRFIIYTLNLLLGDNSKEGGAFSTNGEFINVYNPEGKK